MGSTSKIIFSSFLALSIVLMFLIFSMQKSAQLTLDKQDVEHTVQLKDDIIANTQQKLQAVEDSAKHAITLNAQIPQLQTIIDTIENEKLTYIQQIEELQDNLQIQLEKAANQLTEFTHLQASYKEQQLLLVETEKAQISADMLTTQTTEELKAMQALLNQRDEEMGQFLKNLEQKDQAITFYKEKTEAAAAEIATLKTVRSSSQMNLALVLDELASKTQAVANLTDRIEQLTGSKTLAGKEFAHPKTKIIGAVTEIEALIKRINLENASPEKDLLPSAMAELEDLKITNGLLRSSINEQSALIENLQATLQAKENELTDTIKQSHEIAIPLTERITLLELQLEEAIHINSRVSDDLNNAQKTNAELENLNKSLNTDLESTQSTLEEALKQIAQLSDGLETADTDLQQEKDAILSLTQEMESVKLALSEAQTHNDTLTSQYGELETALANRNEANEQQTEQIKGLQDQLTLQIATIEETDSLKKEVAHFNELIAEKEMVIATLTTQLTENSAQLTSLQADLDQANTQTSEYQNNTLEQEERVARLIEEVAAAKAISEQQSVKLQSAEELLNTLGEKAASNAILEEKIMGLEATLSENQAIILGLQATITSLTEERDQLLRTTMDSDNDGVSDAKDSCPDTVKGATINAEGCEEDTDKDGLVNRLDLCPDTGLDTAIDNAGCSEEQTTVVLEGISFQFGTAELTEDAYPVLNKAAIILQDNPDINMEISGHTDSVGEKETNMQISSLRAQAVMTYLVSRGVAGNRLQAQGYGSEEPIADNTTKIGRAKNRRVELRRIEAALPQQEEETASPSAGE